VRALPELARAHLDQPGDHRVARLGAHEHIQVQPVLSADPAAATLAA
jgi:hypothetical protein